MKADKAGRKATAATEKAAPAEPEIIDAEIVEDDVNTGGPTAPSAGKIAEAEAAAATATADATVKIHLVTDPPAGADATGTPPTAPAPKPPTAAPVPPPRPAPTPPPSAPAAPTGPGADPSPAPAAGPSLRLVKEPEDPPATQPGPAPSGGATTPRSSMTTLPTAATVEVNGVDSLQLWLRQMHGWAQLEMEDAQAALARIADLQAKAEAAYAAAAGAKYDPATLGELAAIVDQLGHLRTARERDLASSELAAHNAAVSEGNVKVRHGAINEAVAAAPVEMAESTTYGD
ncbi:hypothetical protein ACFQ1I_46875 [Kitasatospora arboriphila]